MKIYTADFETTTDVSDCRVWAWCTCDIDEIRRLEYGIDIESFIEWVRKQGMCKLYFHNLGFDGSFIMDYLLKNGWTWIDHDGKAAPKTFKTLISDMNQLYTITHYFTARQSCKIYDSLKIIPLSVKQMAKAYGLDEGKGELDYEAYREVGHKLTVEEMDYIRRDVQIVAKVLKEFLDEGLTRMTAGSNALAQYKKMLGGDKGFRRMYPILDETEDAFIRKAYRGGFTYVNPKYQEQLIGEGIVFDVNSLYPSVMAACDGQLLPYGKPEWFNGEPKLKFPYSLWVAVVTCQFSVKENHIPCIQLKGNWHYNQTEYLERSGIEVTFTVTSVDWELITQQYNLRNVSWFGGFYFKANDTQFKGYVDKWVEVKNQATIDGNAGKRQIAKLMLNSLYGKFATRIQVQSKKPFIYDDVLHFELLEPETRDPVYLPVGVFITAWARYKTITSAQKVYDRFIYADTDSLHLVGTDIPESIDVDDVRLGAWKHESTFTRAKFLRAKCYVEEINENMVVHVAGMPPNVHSQVDFDNFELGAIYNGKLYQKRVDGGIVLVAGDMQLRR